MSSENTHNKSGFRPVFSDPNNIDTQEYKRQSRAYIAKMIAEGRGAEVEDELARNLGIDLKNGTTIRITMISGHKLKVPIERIIKRPALSQDGESTNTAKQDPEKAS